MYIYFLCDWNPDNLSCIDFSFLVNCRLLNCTIWYWKYVFKQSHWIITNISNWTIKFSFRMITLTNEIDKFIELRWMIRSFLKKIDIFSFISSICFMLRIYQSCENTYVNSILNNALFDNSQSQEKSETFFKFKTLCSWRIACILPYGDRKWIS